MGASLGVYCVIEVVSLVYIAVLWERALVYIALLSKRAL